MWVLCRGGRRFQGRSEFLLNLGGLFLFRGLKGRADLLLVLGLRCFLCRVRW